MLFNENFFTIYSALLFHRITSQYGVEYGEFIVWHSLANAQDSGSSEGANIELRKKLLHESFISHNSLGDSDYADNIGVSLKNLDMILTL